MRPRKQRLIEAALVCLGVTLCVGLIGFLFSLGLQVNHRHEHNWDNVWLSGTLIGLALGLFIGLFQAAFTYADSAPSPYDQWKFNRMLAEERARTAEQRDEGKVVELGNDTR